MRAAAGEPHPAHLRGRPRDRLDADRPGRRCARADADQGRRMGGAEVFRAHRADRQARACACRIAARRALDGLRAHLRAAARGLPRRSDLLALPRQRFDAVERRLGRALLANTRAHGMRLARCASRLQPRLLEARLQPHARPAGSAGPARDVIAGAHHGPAPGAAGARRRAGSRRSARRRGSRTARSGWACWRRAPRQAIARAHRRAAAPSRRLRQAAGLARLPGRAAARLCAGARQRGPQRALGGASRRRPAPRYRAGRRPRRGPGLGRAAQPRARPSPHRQSRPAPAKRQARGGGQGSLF